MLVAVILGACRGDTVEPLPQFQSVELAAAARAEISIAVAGEQIRGIEDELLRLEATVPGLGGMWVDEATGQVNVYQKVDANVEGTRAAFRNTRGLAALKPGLTRRLLASRGVNVHRADYTFSELVAFKTALTSRRSLPGVFGYDADERLNRVRLLVKPDADAAAIMAGVAAAGVPARAVSLERSSAFRYTNTLSDRMRPARAGVKITNSGGGICSMGFVVKDLGTNNVGFLTASHCDGLTLGGGATSSHVYQASGSNDHIGNVAINPAWNVAGSQCGSFSICTYADVAFITADSPSNDVRMAIAITSGWSSHVNDNTAGSTTLTGGEWWAPEKLWFSPYSGMTVYKSGQTTGITGGTVSGTCVDVDGNNSRVLCVMEVSGAAVGGGDSGGPVFYPAAGGDPPWAIGIEFGGTEAGEFIGSEPCDNQCKFFFTPWSSIESWLGTTFQTFNGFYTASISGPTDINGFEINCVWQGSTNVPGPTYTWKVDNQTVGTGQTLNYRSSSAFTLELWISNSSGRTAFTTWDVYVDESNPACSPY